MIGRKSPKSSHDKIVPKPRGFDDFELRLGDVMRGERATLGKSLLDVQRELRIKASYIAAIENCDPTAFDTPGFIAGYVRSYARYLGMDPDDTYAVFCAESGFETAHGMSDAASSRKKADLPVATVPARDPFSQPALPFAPSNDSLLSRIEPGAIGSTLVLLLLLGGLGYGGYTVLQEVQRVQLAPVDQTPVVLSDLDPLQTQTQSNESTDQNASVADAGAAAGVFTPPPASMRLIACTAHKRLTCLCWSPVMRRFRRLIPIVSGRLPRSPIRTCHQLILNPLTARQPRGWPRPGLFRQTVSP